MWTVFGLPVAGAGQFKSAFPDSRFRWTMKTFVCVNDLFFFVAWKKGLRGNFINWLLVIKELKEFTKAYSRFLLLATIAES